ncbi:hypothetical protein DM02DRAFT_630390 [Periconia macrospinosa]|uniref:HAD-like protein n=1 Tax=Periconia macrospinosa TaxID=97972 RepID=A0A2V1DJB5_9PLEO|nr:hypothetical protein DM02DRAFT_630390 [Periconia macrospinosa]
MLHPLTYYKPFIRISSTLARRCTCAGTAPHRPRQYSTLAHSLTTGTPSSCTIQEKQQQGAIRAMSANPTIIESEKMKRPRRFAPLGPEKKVEGDARQVLEGIVFDVDGTLCA